jgi:hypothetical protein
LTFVPHLWLKRRKSEGKENTREKKLKNHHSKFIILLRIQRRQ